MQFPKVLTVGATGQQGTATIYLGPAHHHRRRPEGVNKSSITHAHPPPPPPPPLQDPRTHPLGELSERSASPAGDVPRDPTPPPSPRPKPRPHPHERTAHPDITSHDVHPSSSRCPVPVPVPVPGDPSRNRKRRSAGPAAARPPARGVPHLGVQQRSVDRGGDDKSRLGGCHGTWRIFASKAPG